MHPLETCLRSLHDIHASGAGVQETSYYGAIERLFNVSARALLSNAALVEPKDVAWFLASYARDARTRVERATLPALDTVRRSLEEALGITFSGERGEHFFRSTLVQTLFYGIFSAWVLWSSENDDPTARFDWRTAGYYLRVPMMEALFAQVAAPLKLRPPGIMELLDWTGAALNRTAASCVQDVSSHPSQHPTARRRGV